MFDDTVVDPFPGLKDLVLGDGCWVATRGDVCWGYTGDTSINGIVHQHGGLGNQNGG